MNGPLVLASASPRRRELLARLGVPFVVAPTDVDEVRGPAEAPHAYALRLAGDKARAGARGLAAGTVIGADTIVVQGDEVLGKPADAADAVRMLRQLRGRPHAVITAVAALDVASGRLLVDHARTEVWLRDLGDDEIAAYVASGDPMDKAGAYAIQNADFHPVERIEGSETNVIGLPVDLVAELLARLAETGVPRQDARN